MTKKIHGRHGARWVAVQGFYAWLVSQGSLGKIEADLMNQEFQWDSEPQQKALKVSFEKAYLQELFQAIGEQRSTLDELMAPFLDRTIDELHAIEHAILWIAFFELKDKIEIPYKVIINEAIELAKQFGAQDSHKFINGVLDKAAKQLRSKELSL